MADWSFTSFVLYTHDGNSGNYGAGDVVSETGTLTDQQSAPDEDFDIGEDLFVGGNSVGTFYGTYTEGGNLFIIVATGDDSAILYSQLTGPETDAVLANTVNQTDVVQTGFTTCFLAGTLIATPQGETPIERLAIGDLVLDADGKAMPVRWIGKQTVHTRFAPPERLMPVCIRAGALGEALPHTDLRLTVDHAVFVGGVLCNAGALVNGTTIERLSLKDFGDRYEVYHIETEHHALIRANGLASETFIDSVPRKTFDNHAAFQALYGDAPATIPMMPYPRALSKRQLPAAVRVLVERPVAA